MRRTHWRQCWLPYTLAVVLALPPNAGAQAPAAAPDSPPQPATIHSLKVRVLAGSQEMNDLEGKVMAPLVVQVLDQNDLPVEGADVIFRFPLTGASATFPNQKSTQRFRTNADGQAAATGWTANGQVGAFQVQVTASRGNELGTAVISMTNVTRITEQRKARQKGWWSSRRAKIILIAGAAAVITTVVVLATRSSGGPKVITATPGSPTIGAPQ
jgi:hypothetical protein